MPGAIGLGALAGKLASTQVESFKNKGLVGSALTGTKTNPGLQADLSLVDDPSAAFKARQEALRTSLGERNKWSQQVTDLKVQAARGRQQQPIGSRQPGGVGTTQRGPSSNFTGQGVALKNSGYEGAQQLAKSAGGVRGQIISAAAEMLGTPYAWGGGGAGIKSSYGVGKGTQNVYGVDCSGLTSYVFSRFGLKLPHLANKQTTLGIRTHINNARPGDLVGWTKGGHVAIYAGNGYIIESPNVGKTVRLRKLGPNESVYGVRLTLPGD